MAAAPARHMLGHTHVGLMRRQAQTAAVIVTILAGMHACMRRGREGSARGGRTWQALMPRVWLPGAPGAPLLWLRPAAGHALRGRGMPAGWEAECAHAAMMGACMHGPGFASTLSAQHAYSGVGQQHAPPLRTQSSKACAPATI